MYELVRIVTGVWTIFTYVEHCALSTCIVHKTKIIIFGFVLFRFYWSWFKTNLAPKLAPNTKPLIPKTLASNKQTQRLILTKKRTYIVRVCHMRSYHKAFRSLHLFIEFILFVLLHPINIISNRLVGCECVCHLSRKNCVFKKEKENYTRLWARSKYTTGNVENTKKCIANTWDGIVHI